MKAFKRALLFFYLAVVVYYYCTLDREKSLAWFEKVAVKVGTVVAREKLEKMMEAQMEAAARKPASPQSGLQPAPLPIEQPRVTILAHAPELIVGQTLKFHNLIEDAYENKTLKEKTIEWELVSAANDRFRWEDGDGTVEIYSLLSFLPPISASGNYIRRAEKNKIEGDLNNFFPLTSGKSMAFKISRQAGSQLDSYTLTCTAGEYAPMTTPAGTFKTIPIRCQSDLKGFISESYSYSPQLGHWIASERASFQNGKVIRHKSELVGFVTPAPPLRKPAGP